jgi:peptidoglycan/LPS O-acetylase OafA/YrhL
MQPLGVKAVAVAILLALAPRSGWGPLASPGIAVLGRRSYSLFLIHYPICLLGNAVFVQLGSGSAAVAIAGLVVTWLACNAASALLYRWVESAGGTAGDAGALTRLWRARGPRRSGRLASK